MFIPLVLVGVIANLGMAYSAEQNLIKQQKQVIQSVVDTVGYHIDQGGRILDAVARVAETSGEANLSIFMESTWKAYGYFETIYYLDEGNKIKLMMPSDYRYTGLDMSNILSFKKSGGNKDITISLPFISPRTGEPTVYLNRALSNGGYVIGELNLGLFQQDILSISDKSNKDFVFIMDGTGKLLAHPSSDMVKQQINFSNLGMYQSILTGKTNDFYMYNGRRFIGSAAKLEGTGWIIVDQVPLSVFFSTYALTLGLTLLASVIIWLILVRNLGKELQRYVVTPLEHLSRGTNALTAGDFSQYNSIESIPTAFNELNKLAADFKFMNYNLQVRENSLQESEKRYRGLFNRVPIGLFSVTISGEILNVNPMVVFILGYPSKEELFKMNINNLLYKPSMDNTKEEAVIGDIWNEKSFETQLKHYDGTIIWVQINVNIVCDAKDEKMYLEGSIQDITQRKHTENMIKKQQELLLKAEIEKREILEKALVMKDQFISLISHEFKTPLNVIYSAIQLIECIYFNQISDRVKELIGSIKTNTFRQLRLANNLLDITKLNSGHFKLNMKNIDIVFLIEAITESVELYANQKNIEISFDSNMITKIISIDEEKVERIILNILSNAIKFTNNGGRVDVILSENSELDLVEIKIIDTGIGIPKDKQELIFERFGQVDSNLSRQAEGTGIGLSLVKSLVDILEGAIEVKSELGVGSTFIIKLPVKEGIVDDEVEACLDFDNRLVNEIKVEFSDIYL
ncbi:PAS domain S-box-containing protein [Clostridium pascui]|nr:PAS domain S-box-containing protein [Clostridium pascui]